MCWDFRLIDKLILVGTLKQAQNQQSWKQIDFLGLDTKPFTILQHQRGDKHNKYVEIILQVVDIGARAGIKRRDMLHTARSISERDSHCNKWLNLQKILFILARCPFVRSDKSIFQFYGFDRTRWHSSKKATGFGARVFHIPNSPCIFCILDWPPLWKSYGTPCSLQSMSTAS